MVLYKFYNSKIFTFDYQNIFRIHFLVPFLCNIATQTVH